MRELYSQKIFPVILDHVMQFDSLMEARQKLLADVAGMWLRSDLGRG